LHALAQVFTTHKVALHMAKILTLSERVEDVFIISGAALQQSRTQIQFKQDLLTALMPVHPKR